MVILVLKLNSRGQMGKALVPLKKHSFTYWAAIDAKLHFLFYFSVFIGLRTRAGIVQSVQRLATGWTVRGSNPGGGEIFRTRPDRPWGPPSLL